jgi:WD40 repeat protein
MHTTVAGVLLRKLETIEDVEKQVLYQAWKQKGPTEYPSKVALPEPASLSLIDQVQNKLDIEGKLRLLRKQRIGERGDIIYIPPQAVPSLKATDDTQFSLMDKAKEFLDSDRKVFLVLGDSGAGKSTFSRELEFKLWQSYKSKTGRIPLHIDLPAIHKPECDMIAKQLRKADFSESQIRKMKHHRKFILICDGYDESQQTHNLYTSNQLNQTGEWDAQMVITCRSEHLGSKYRDRFQPRDHNYQEESVMFQEAAILPFSLDQVHDYIRLYVSTRQPQWKVEDYKQAIDLIPGLKDLVTNPLLMSLSLDVLPRLVDLEESLESIRVTRGVLYDHFVEQWLERSKARFVKKDMSLIMREAFKKLNAEGFVLNGIGYLKSFAVAIYKEQGGHPVVEYSHFLDQGSWKEVFFSSREMQILHEACPLTRNGNQHQFIHRSLLEHGLARAIFDPQDRRSRAASKSTLDRRGSASSTLSFEIYGGIQDVTTNSEDELDLNSPLVWRSFVNDHSLMQALEEQVRQEPIFKKQLLAYIERSKKDEKWRRAAANAITILVRAGVQFIEADFRGVRIPGANLSYGVFDSVQFQGADMRKVNLQGAWLRQTNLSRADMTGVLFGELPYDFQSSASRCSAYSADGELFAVGHGHGSINVYSTLGWKLSRIFVGHDGAILRVAFAPKGDQLASASVDRTVRLWDVASGKCLHILIGHLGSVNGVTFSPQGDRVTSFSHDGTLRLWCPATGRCLRTIYEYDYKATWCVAYSPMANQIASGGGNSEVRLWDIETRECSCILTGHSDVVFSIAFSPQGDKLASCSLDKTVRLWDVKTGATFKVLSGHTMGVFSIAFSPQGDRVVSGGQDATVRVWDVESGICRRIWIGHARDVESVAYSPKGDRIVSGSYDNSVRLWDVAVEASHHMSSGHSRVVRMIKYSPKRDILATCSDDATIQLWDVKAGDCRRTLKGHKGSVKDVAFSPQGDRVISGGADHTIRFWDVETGACRNIFKGHAESILSIAYSPQGDQIVSSSSDKTVQLWDVATGENRGSLKGQTREVLSVVYSPDSRLIATGSRDGIVQLWIAETRTCCNALEGHSLQVAKVVFSPRGDQIASASYDGSVRVWNVYTGRCRFTLTGHRAAVVSVAYSHKGDRLATCSKDNTVRFWDVASGECRGEIKNLQGRVWCLDWTATTDENFLITGCRDGSVLKWQIAEEGERCRAQLCWRVTNGLLNAGGVVMKDVKGLTELDKQLLNQRWIENEVDHWRSLAERFQKYAPILILLVMLFALAMAIWWVVSWLLSVYSWVGTWITK